MALDPLYELERARFYVKRDGFEAAVEKLKELKTIYLQAYSVIPVSSFLS